MPDYPKSVNVGTDKATAYELRADLHSVRQPADASQDKAVAVIPDGKAAAFAVYKGTPAQDRGIADVGPVYAAGPEGPFAVPTGRVFVRFANGVRADERKKQFEKAGFEIDKTLSYAPNAIWLRPATGGVHRALPALASLSKLPDVEHVEPQLLLERELKG